MRFAPNDLLQAPLGTSLLLAALFMTTVDGSLLISCAFDDEMDRGGLCAFNNTGSYPWARRSGDTPSSTTGPTSDHTTGSGSYVYVEASSPNSPYVGPFTLEARLPEVPSGGAAVSFYYSMNGETCGTLQVLTSSDDGTTWVVRWSKAGDQGTPWHRADVGLEGSAPTRLRFTGVTGADYTGDLALDDVNVTALASPPPSLSPAPSLTPQPSGAPSQPPTAPPSTVLLTTEAQLVAGIVSNASLTLGMDLNLTSAVVVIDVAGLVLSGGGLGGGEGFALSGGGLVRCLYFRGGDALLMNLEVKNGYGSSKGGAVLLEGGAWVTMVACQVTGSSAGAASGGGVYVQDSGTMLVLLRCAFVGNVANSGGGLRVTGGAKSEVSNTTFTGNEARFSSGGGAEVSGAAAVSFEGCVFVGNMAAVGGGGGMALFAASVSLVGCVLKSNGASSGGGVLVDSSSQLNLTDTVVTGNSAFQGGGVYVAGSATVVRLESVYVQDNQASSASGGGMVVASGSVEALHSAFSNNTARCPTFELVSRPCYVLGGCFYSDGYPDDYAVLTQCVFRASANGTLATQAFNTEEGYDSLEVGGVLYTGREGPQATPVLVEQELTWYSDRLTISSGFEVCYTTTSSGGGMHLIGGATTLTNSTVFNNQATTHGGGISVDGGSVELRGGSAIHGNAAASGRGVHIVSGAFRASALTLARDQDVGGVSASTATCSSQCSRGEFGNCSLAPGTDRCFVNCGCDTCVSGCKIHNIKETS